MKKNQTQRGFSLLELLLVVVIMTIITSGAAVVFDDWFRDSLDRKVGREMKTIQNAAEQYTQLNFDDILAVIPSDGNIAEIDIQDIIGKGFLSSNFRAENSFRQVMKVIVRNITAVGDDPTIEVITVTDDPSGFDARKKDARLARAATSGGPKVGVISNLNTGSQCCDGNIQSLQGLWILDRDDFSSIYNVDPTVEHGGYMAAYGKISELSTVNDDYLYRVKVGIENSNRMNTNLSLNNNDVINAGSLSVDNINITGNAEIGGLPSTSLETSHSFAVQRDFITEQNISVLSSDGTVTDNTKGDIIVQGDNTVDTDFILTGALDVFRQTDSGPISGDTITSNLETDDLRATSGSGANFNSVVFSSGQMSANNIYTNSASLNGSLDVKDIIATDVQNVGTIETQTLIAVDATMGGETNIDNDLFVVNSTSINSNSTISGNVNGSASGQGVVITNMSECGAGCTGYEGSN